METTTAILVSKIEKLWRKASDAGATPAEREAFEAKALSLMEENRITMAMLEIDQEDILGDHLYGTVRGKYARVVTDLLTIIAYAYDCRVWWRNFYGGDKQVYIFGFRSDAERVIALGQMLIADGQAQASKLTGPTPGESFSARHSFLHGFAAAVGRRLREAAAMANKAMADEHGETATKGAALVLVSRREQVHEQYSRKALKHAAPSRASNGSAYQRGVAAGNSASLNTQGRIANRKALTS